MATCLAARRAEDGVWVLTLRASRASKDGEHENRFTPELVRAVHAALDRVLDDESGKCCAVVLTGGDGKFFCNGHDAEWLVDAAARADGSAEAFLGGFYSLLARLMTFPVPTVACVNGHAFAGGLLLALACDYRVMRSDKGLACMNEVDMALVPAPPSDSKPALRPGMFRGADRKMAAVVQARLAAPAARDVFLRGLRMSASDAARLGVVDVAPSAPGYEAALGNALALAKALGQKCPARNRRTWFVLKHELATAPVLRDLTAGGPPLSSFQGVVVAHL